MRTSRLILVSIFVLVVATAAFAEEVVFFTNGTSMPIRAHLIEDGMMHVDLGGSGFIAFPVGRVDRVETAGDDVILKPSFSARNRVTPTGSYPATGQGRRDRSKNLPEADPANDVVVDENTGLAVYKPYRHDQQKGKRMLGAAGHQAVSRGAGSGSGTSKYPGTVQVGNRHVIGGKPGTAGRQASQRRQVVGLEMRDNPASGGSKSSRKR